MGGGDRIENVDVVQLTLTCILLVSSAKSFNSIELDPKLWINLASLRLMNSRNFFC